MHGAGVNAQPGADHGQGVALGVHQNGVPDLIAGESSRLGGHVVAFEDRADGSPIDSVPLGQLGHHVAGPIALDKVGLLGLGESPLALPRLGDPARRTGFASARWL